MDLLDENPADKKPVEQALNLQASADPFAQFGQNSASGGSWDNPFSGQTTNTSTTASTITSFGNDPFTGGFSNFGVNPAPNTNPSSTNLAEIFGSNMGTPAPQIQQTPITYTNNSVSAQNSTNNQKVASGAASQGQKKVT